MVNYSINENFRSFVLNDIIILEINKLTDFLF